MRNTCGSSAVAAMVLSLTAVGRAQGQTDEPVSLDLDANLGFESLQEPAAIVEELGELTTNPYLTVNLAALINLWNAQVVLHGPLRFNIDDSFALRDEDWDETDEILRAFRCARIDYMVTRTSSGVVEEHLPESGSCISWTPDEAVGAVHTGRQEFLYLSARLHPVYNYSLGYASIINGYNAMLEEDHFREGALVEANINRRFIIAGALSDITDPTVLAGRVAFRPVQASGQRQGGSGMREGDLFVELGVTTATDFRAPIGFIPETGGVEDHDAVVVGGVDARIRISETDTVTMGEYRVMRFEFGTEYNQLFDLGSGLHNHLRFYYDVGPFDFYVDGEYRLILGQYIPSYFDQHYRVQRTQYVLSEDQREQLGTDLGAMTKLDFVRNLPDETEHGYGALMRFRFWQDAGTGRGWDRLADIWLFQELIPGRDLSGRAGVGLTVYELADDLSLTGIFVQQGWDDLAGLFSFDNSVLNIDARWFFTESFYLDFFYDQTWFLVEGTQANFDTTNDVGVQFGWLQ